MAKNSPAEVQFSNELLNVFVRWSEESDLTPLQMAEIAAIVINNFCGDEASIEFEPDSEMLDQIDFFEDLDEEDTE